ncbi:DMT family transporter [Bacillus sp. FJAT-50079]|uniref:DMT family transporter n=1 Tax=Bacillus sp. FJAT-50079 TaxID=2833577 RepID=UPI001BC9D01B|nr:DMT family transporter [Bacillus sp. FJAT-50079]MBS4208254.1 DMT family transporter [Bacillus sp. FJAT-50079]
MRNSFLYIILVLMMMVWGFNIIAIKVVVTAFPAITITSLRVFIAFLAILPVLFYRKVFRKFTRQEFLFILGIAITGILGHQYLMSVGLKYTTAANGGLILGAVPIVTSIAASFFLGDRLTASRVVGLIFGFIGVASVMVSGASEAIVISRGDLYFCFAVFVQTVSFILVKKASATVDIALLTGMTQLIGSGFLFMLAVPSEPNGIQGLQHGTTVAWTLFLFSGIIATGVGHFVYNYAIQQVGAGKSALFLNLTPLFSVIGSYFFLGETIYAGQWLGFGLIVAGVTLGTGVMEQVIKKRDVPA